MTRKIAVSAILTSLAIILGFIETLIPMPVPFPGVKLGLSNIAVLMAFYVLGGGTALFVLTAKIFLCGLLFSGISGIMYSISGGILAFAVMFLLKKSDRFSIVGVSATGAIFHNIGQILAAAFVVQNTSVLYYVPVLIISGVVTGIITGITAKITLKYLL